MTELRFDDEVALITGAAGSIGGAYATLLGSRGARLVLNDLETSKDRLEALTEQLRAAGIEATSVAGDASDGAPELVEAAMSAHGRIDVVLANAGIGGGGGPIGEADMEAFETVVDVNFRGTYRLMHLVWPHLVASGGRAVLTSSASVFGTRGAAPYTSSKAAVMTLARTLGMDGESSGVRVNAVMPIAWSQMLAKLPPPEFSAFMEEHYQADHVASAVAWIAHRSTTVNRETFAVGGGFLAQVSLVTNWGAVKVDASPEDWRDRAADITDFSRGWFHPQDGGADVNFRSDRALGHHVDSIHLH